MALAKFDVKEKEIGGHVFYVRPFPPLEALALLGDLQAVLTSSMKDSVTPQGENILDADINMATILANIGNNLKGDVLVKFANRLLDKEYVSVKYDGETVRLSKDIINDIFSARISDMLKLLYFVIEVNYDDFFALLPDRFGLAGTLGKK